MSPAASNANAEALWAPTPSPSSTQASRRKRRRINHACNFCRARKTRCDESRPSCMACQAAGVDCVTTNLRKPSSQVTRHEAGRRPPDATPHITAAKVSAVPSPRQQQNHDARQTSSVSPASPSSPPQQPQQPPPTLSAPTSPGRTRRSLPVFQQSRGNTYCEILSDWVDVAFYRLGIRSAWPAPMPLSQSPSPSRSFSSFGLCPLPGPDTLRQAADTFLAGPNTLFPVMARDTVVPLLEAAHACGPVDLVRQAGYPSLLLTYVIILIGGVSAPVPPPDLDTMALLECCTTLMGHVLQETTLDTVKAMLLLAMAQRCCNNVMASWNAMSLAVSTANTIGLAQLSRQGPTGPDDERSAVWKSVCIFEKMLAFELGRSSRTASLSVGRGSPAHSVSSTPSHQTCHEVQAANATESLALTLDVVARRCIDITARAQTNSSADLAARIHDKIKTIGEAVLSLMDWANSIPYALSPTADLIQDQRYQPFASFLSLQYHNAVILLTRNSLLLSEEVVHYYVDKASTGAAWESIARGGRWIAANAARKILQLVIRSADSRTASILPCLVAPLHAIIALTIYDVTITSRESAADNSLLKTAVDVLRETCLKGKNGAAVHSLLANLETMRQDAMQKTTFFGPENSPAAMEAVAAAVERPPTHTARPASRIATTEAASRGVTGGWWQESDNCGLHWPDQISWDWFGFSDNFGDGSVGGQTF